MRTPGPLAAYTSTFARLFRRAPATDGRGARAAVLGTLAVALTLTVGTAAHLGVQPARTDRSPAANTAFIETGATRAVLGDASTAVDSVLTTTPGTVRATRNSARRLLQGPAVAQYAKLYGPALRLAAAGRLSLTTTVRALGVTSLEADTARVLLLADQSASARGGRPQVGSAQISLLMKRHGRHWRIADINVL